MSIRVVVDNGLGRRRRASLPGEGRDTPALRLQVAEPAIALRSATAADAPALHALIASHLEEGHLLPRSLDELAVHAPRFVVAVRVSTESPEPGSAGSPQANREIIVGCAELAPLSAKVAEVRSLVVGREARKHGLGLRMVDELSRRARREDFNRLCAFAHDPTFFVRLGFSIVPHTWVPEKIAHDCHGCPLFRTCGQHAVVVDLHSVGTAVVITSRTPARQSPRA